jgi:hypothetical protein
MLHRRGGRIFAFCMNFAKICAKIEWKDTSKNSQEVKANSLSIKMISLFGLMGSKGIRESQNKIEGKPKG